MTFDEMREKINGLPIELRLEFSGMCSDYMNRERYIRDWIAEGKITQEQLNTWKECVRTNMNLLLM